MPAAVLTIWWIAIGLAIYFGYSRKHAALRTGGEPRAHERIGA